MRKIPEDRSGKSLVGQELPKTEEVVSENGEVQERFEPEAHPPTAENWPPWKGGIPARWKMMFYVYVLWSERLCKRYVGCTGDIEGRLAVHNAGGSRFTKGGIPWTVIHTEEFEDLSSARKREKFLKTGVGRAWLDKNFPRPKK